jgi:15-cis-phytoene desaturase
MQRYLASMEGAVLSGKLCADKVNKSRKRLFEHSQQNEITSEKKP